uniref:N-acetyltransferase domain-containing protein n=1 Tax=Alexandrium monilatum TaxID=311494 RepID=A0A7S4V0C9_9DINO|mmetsp:Transcript_18082/g.56628  ORF Transcript_18082/g.56628 Transcript_18082/m.56628 type:complete len:568 (-) Transcript_18082:54-1757(-)
MTRSAGPPKAPAAAQKLFFRVRDDEEPAVMEALSGGLRDPKAKFMPDQQDLMFFAAARRRSLGGSEAIARRLCSLGVPGNSIDRLRQTPLFFAAREGNRDCATFLVEQRCEVNHRDVYGQSPLFYSVRESHVEMCRLLRDLGASFDIRDNNKNTAVFYAKGEAAAALARMHDEHLIREVPLSKVLDAGHPNPDGRKAAQGEKTVLTRKATLAQGAVHGREATPAPAAHKRRRVAAPPQAADAGSGPEPPPAASPEVDPSPVERPPERRKEVRPAPAEAASCRGSQHFAAMQAMVKWAAIGTDGAAAVYPRPRCRGAEAAGRRGPPPPAIPPPEKIFSQAGEYSVCSPGVGDAWRLRELEREFVLDHFDVFSDVPWHAQLDPLGWCRLVNVIESEDMARQAITSIIAGKTPRHCTLQCVHVPRALPGEKGPVGTPSVVGYVHVVNAGGHLDVSHLKVQRSHQRRGLGSLLMAGTIRWAERQGVEVRDLQLVVVVKNAPAISLYRSLGFEDLNSVQRRDPLGGGVVKWQKMWRPFGRSVDASAFARLCEARAAAASRAAARPREPPGEK